MKFSIGYQPATESIPSVVDLVTQYDCVDEVYFPWVQLPSGRSPLREGHRAQLEADLAGLRDRGIKLNLLLNASCWGAEGFTKTLANKLAAVVGELADRGWIDSVTVCSPMIARLIKREFPAVAVRASVNMKLGTIDALEQTADLFDGFNVARERNHDLEHLATIGQWACQHGKHMQLLANSGCIPHCAVQMFHDNLVAHEGHNDTHGDRFADHIPGGCWERFSDRDNWWRVLAGTWIRPEDVHHYETITPRLKLATRMHARPGIVLRAYARGRFAGNLTDLLEPSHSPLLAPWVIDNTRFPVEWFETITAPSSREATNEYYQAVLKDVLVNTATWNPHTDGTHEHA